MRNRIANIDYVGTEMKGMQQSETKPKQARQGFEPCSLGLSPTKITVTPKSPHRLLIITRQVTPFMARPEFAR